MTYTLNGTNLQDVQGEKHKTRSNLEQYNFPLAPTQQAFVDDYGDVLRRITITGFASFATEASLMNDFIVPLDALQNGAQSAVIFHSDLWDASTSGDYQDGNFYVKVDDFDWDYIAGETLRVKFTIILLEGQ